MEILGVGPSELIFIIIIALIVLGPKDMQKAGKTIGQYLNKLVRSDGWKAFQQTSRELRNLPTNLMREANMDLAEAEKDIRKSIDPRQFSSASPSNRSLPQSRGADNINQTSSAKSADAADSDHASDITLNTPEGDVSKPNQNA